MHALFSLSGSWCATLDLINTGESFRVSGFCFVKNVCTQKNVRKGRKKRSNNSPGMRGSKAHTHTLNIKFLSIVFFCWGCDSVIRQMHTIESNAMKLKIKRGQMECLSWHRAQPEQRRTPTTAMPEPHTKTNEWNSIFIVFVVQFGRLLSNKLYF